MAGGQVDSLYIEISADSKKAGKSIDELCERLSKLQKGLGHIGSSSNANFEKLQTNAKKLNNVFSTNGTTIKSLTYSFGRMYLKIKALKLAFRELGKVVESSMNYVETSNFWNVALNKIGADFGDKFEQFGYDNAESYINSFSERLKALNKKMTGYTIGENGEAIFSGDIGIGVDIERLMNFQAKIMGVANSIGLLGETSINASKALSMLATDFSSLTNTKLETVMTNLQSGLIGQSRALYKYGIDITNATLQQYALANGISKAVSEMTQSEKMQLRLLAILDQSKIAWGDQILTINSVANQFRVFQQQISNLARTIGNLLLPIVQKVLPYLNAFTILINRALNALGFKIFGKSWLSDIQDGISGGAIDGIEELAEEADGVANSFGNAANNAKKLKGQLQGFDELNNLSSKSDTGSVGGTSLGSGGASFDLSGAISDSLAEYESVWNKAFANASNRAQELANKILSIFNNGFWEKLGFSEVATAIRGGLQPAFELLTKKIIPDLNTGFNSLKNILKPLGEFLKGAFADAWTKIIIPALKRTGETVLPKVINVFENLWDNLVLFGKFLESALTPVINLITWGLENLWKKVVEPLAQVVGSVLAEAFEGLCDVINYTVIPIGQKITQVLSFLLDNVLRPVGNYLFSTFEPIFESVFESIGIIINTAKNAFSGLISFITGVFTGNWSKAWNGIKTTFTSIFDGVKTSATTIMTGLWSTLKNVINSIISGIEKMANAIVNGINTMIRALNKLSFKIPNWVPSLGGKSFGLNLKTVQTISIPRVYATGGFPEDGWFRANHGEIMGRFDNGQSVVANNKQITDGIAAAVYEGNKENNALIRQELSLLQRQNELLLGILEKETGISANDIFKSVRKSADEYMRRTGNPAFSF